jgi:hypothetical protein
VRAMEILVLSIVAVFFLLSFGLIAFCERLH